MAADGRRPRAARGEALARGGCERGAGVGIGARGYAGGGTDGYPYSDGRAFIDGHPCGGAAGGDKGGEPDGHLYRECGGDLLRDANTDIDAACLGYGDCPRQLEGDEHSARDGDAKPYARGWQLGDCNDDACGDRDGDASFDADRNRDG